MSKYDFDPVRLKKNLTLVADYIHGTPCDAFDKQKVLDEIAADVEDLHRKAQQLDSLWMDIHELTFDEYISPEELRRTADNYTDANGDLIQTPDLDL